MSLNNSQIAQVLLDIADILEEQDENPYKIRAYRRAAKSLKNYSTNVIDLIKNNESLTIIPNIGKKISEVINKIVFNQDLSLFLKEGQAKPYPIQLLKKKRKPLIFKIFTLMPIVEKILARLKSFPEIKKIECAGDYRRKKEIVHDLDILLVTTDSKKVFSQFHLLPSIKYIIETTQYKTTVELKNGLWVSIHAVKKAEWGSKLLEATGSKDHYNGLQNKAYEKNFSLKPEGLFKNKQKYNSESELSIYQTLNLSFIPSELRENRGELETAEIGHIPKLVELSDIRGDLHCHTNETDGFFSLEEMVETARNKGYSYVAITDHSKALKITNGLNEERLMNQIKMIDQLNAKLFNFTILKSIEVDILENGNLDLSNDILKELDLTVCSIHSKFGLSLEKQTERIIRAMDNPYFNILGHATGRLITRRPPYKVDIERILKAAKASNCFIEVNAQPARLDINDIYCKQAKELGVKVAISSDAHTTKGFNFMILGVNQARRGWLEAHDVINTYELPELKEILKRK